MKPELSSNNATVLTIIVSYNAIDCLKKCIPSVKSDPISSDIFVIDNNSTPDVIQYLQAQDELTLFQSSKNIGFGRANNIALASALKNSYKYVFLLNQDAYIEKNCISDLVKIADENPEFGILSPAHLNGRDDKLDPKFSQNYVAPILPELLHDIENGKSKSVYMSKYANAAAWLIRTRSLNLTGGFDPLFFMYGEDDDLCDRMRYHKQKIGICPSLFVNHTRHQSNQSTYMKRIVHLIKVQYSRNIYTAKYINRSFLSNFYVLSVNTFTVTLNKLLMQRKLETLFVSICAYIAAISKLYKIYSHWKQQKKRGAHWLVND